jgi:hypothetical protein
MRKREKRRKEKKNRITYIKENKMKQNKIIA